MLIWLIHWRKGLLNGLLFLLIVIGSARSFSSEMAERLSAGWWVEQQHWATAGWQRQRLVRQTIPLPAWWAGVHTACRWGRGGVLVGFTAGLLCHLLAHSGPAWAWLLLLAVSHVTVREIGRLWGRGARPSAVEVVSPGAEAPSPSGSSVEVEVDLSSLLAELGDLSPTAEVTSTAREELTARLERIRAECFQHPVSQALAQQLETGVRQVVQRILEEALESELTEFLGFERYERTGEAKPPERLRSGSYPRSLRTLWGIIEQLRVPKLRCGNKRRTWQVLEKYERSFGPWLDLQLHWYTLGLSQADLQEILYLSLGQVLSVKAIEHLTTVAQKEMEAFRRASLTDTPPVIVVDGVNLKIQCPTGVYRTNQRGQQRAVTRRETHVLLAALGIWPDGHYQVLHFEVVDQETKANWRQFLQHLLDKGLDGSQMQLVVSDGRPGLNTAIRAIFPDTVRHQRCIFHKLKNLADNLTFEHLTLAPELPHREAVKQAKLTRARAILHEAAAIYTGSDLQTIQQHLDVFREKWEAIEPKAVRCFLNDFDMTLNYLRVPFPHKQLIRTTNLLERFFREFRTRAGEIGCFGSLTQAETLFYLILQREKAKHAVA